MRKQSAYLGHPSQLAGVEEHVLSNGKGRGMRLLEIRNGCGLEVVLLPDRCMDVARVFLEGVNLGYVSPSGYVAPAFYDHVGNGFLKSFSAGFLTTCGLTAAGAACRDGEEEVGLHGPISNTPCEHYSWEETEDSITIRAEIRQAWLFADQMKLTRKYVISKRENELALWDCVENIGQGESPLMLLYHFNMGYPLLTERAELVIPHHSVAPRDKEAEGGLDHCLVMEPPQRGYREQCFYYQMKSKEQTACAGIYNPEIQKGLTMCFDSSALDCFTEWKMMGEHEYVLGLEPGNCTPDGRAVLRKEGRLKTLQPGQQYHTGITLSFLSDEGVFHSRVKEFD